MASSQQTRLDHVESLLVQQRITEALTLARSGTKADFAPTLRASLPGTATHVWVYLALMRDDELALLAEEGSRGLLR
jgi:hypothetical protein